VAQERIADGGPRILVTGAAGGIGGAAAAALRDRGADVLGLDLRAGKDVLACDVRDQTSVDAAVDRAVERLGGLDALINAAGIGLPQSATAPPADDARAVLDVNLLGTWRVTAAALPTLRASRGRVVNVASGLVHIAFPFATAYAASKRGVAAYSDQLRAEVGDEVTVTTVYPGYVRTAIHDASHDQGISLADLVREEPLSAAVATLVRAVYGRPARDLATTRRSGFEYGLLRVLGPSIGDRVVRQRVRAAAHAGRYDATELAAGLAARLRDRRGGVTGRRSRSGSRSDG
jgi:NAD(P)-dependent dehydrogenase (short-subunit alcohol dehydrogenase family)